MSGDSTTIEEGDSTPKALRATVDRLQNQVKELETENATLKGHVRASSFRQAGIDPDKGVGKAIAALYQGDPDPAKIIEFAKAEFDFEVAPSPTQQAAQVVTDAVGRVQSAVDATHPSQESTIDSQIAEAQRAKDFVRVAQLQVQKIAAAATGAVV